MKRRKSAGTTDKPMQEVTANATGMDGLLQKPLGTGEHARKDSAAPALPALPVLPVLPALPGVRLGRVVSVPHAAHAIGSDHAPGQGENAGLRVLLPHCAEPLAAQALCALTAEDVGRPCAVLFVDNDPTRPLVVGCVVQDVPAAAHAHISAEAAPQELEFSAPTRPFASDDDREVVVDGEIVRIEARNELELRCGESVILLLRDGRIEIRGNYVTSQATATQRIRGGSVHIN